MHAGRLDDEDLIYEGIATFYTSCLCCESTLIDDEDLIYEGIATILRSPCTVSGTATTKT